MQKSILLSIVGILLLCFGIFWLATIYKRCEVIYPTEKTTAAAVGPSSITEAARAIQKIRSPYAKEYHFILFWVLAGLEVGCAMGYLVAGTALWRRFPLGRVLGFVAIGLDIFFKIFTLFYMFFCAVPLAKVTQNPNVLQAYFYADKGVWAWFSGWVSGLMILGPAVILGILVYVLYYGSLIQFLNSNDVKAAFSRT